MMLIFVAVVVLVIGLWIAWEAEMNKCDRLFIVSIRDDVDYLIVKVRAAEKKIESLEKINLKKE